MSEPSDRSSSVDRPEPSVSREPIVSTRPTGPAGSPEAAWADSLGIRADCAAVIASARSVRIDPAAGARLANQLFSGAPELPAWEGRWHFQGEPWQTANWLLVLDSVNFCFWGTPRWEITYRGERLSGYWGLAAALTRAITDLGLPLWDAEYLAGLPDRDARAIFSGSVEIPLFAERVANLRETGRVLRDELAGSFLTAIDRAGGDAPALAGLVADSFPSFRDLASYQGRPVRLLKRAQILAADLVGAFSAQEPGALTNLAGLTAFADYKLPQVLRHHGVLIYEPRLAARIDNQDQLAPGSPEEVEIRASTIGAVDLLATLSRQYVRHYRPFEVDWLLWQLGQSLPADVAPYHRTRTIFY